MCLRLVWRSRPKKSNDSSLVDLIIQFQFSTNLHFTVPTYNECSYNTGTNVQRLSQEYTHLSRNKTFFIDFGTFLLLALFVWWQNQYVYHNIDNVCDFESTMSKNVSQHSTQLYTPYARLTTFTFDQDISKRVHDIL